MWNNNKINNEKNIILWKKDEFKLCEQEEQTESEGRNFSQDNNATKSTNKEQYSTSRKKINSNMRYDI